MNSEQNQLSLQGVAHSCKSAGKVFNPKEFKIQTLRECATPVELQLCDTPDKAASYWRSHVVNHPYYNPDVETMVVIMLNISFAAVWS